ncbi:MAG: protein phosphatase 2C domain-containing protein [Ruminococcus sp.]|nr:protein phosphatase 2C domain-containing protein [Ruminococcus sp.]
MNARSFNISVQGYSHIKKGKPVQDYSVSYNDEHCSIAIICDGHGGDDYIRSAVGSMIAAKTADAVIKSFVKNFDKSKFFDKSAGNPEALLNKLEEKIVSSWRERVKKHCSENPFTEDELTRISAKARKKYEEEKRIFSAYGTTLIAAVMTEDFWFALQIGDGKCVRIKADGTFDEPIPDDPKCFLNATTSLCDADAAERCRACYSLDDLSSFVKKTEEDGLQKFQAYGLEKPAAIFVSSDGVDDSFGDREQMNNFYKTVLYSFSNDTFENAKSGIEEYLPRLSEKGSGDDISISAVLNFDIIPELDMVKNYSAQAEKQRVEQLKKAQAERDAEEKRIVEERIQKIEAEKAERERQQRLAEERDRRRREEIERQRREAEERRRREIEAKRRRSGSRVIEFMYYCPRCGEVRNMQAAYSGGVGNFCERCGEGLYLYRFIKQFGRDNRPAPADQPSSNPSQSFPKTIPPLSQHPVENGVKPDRNSFVDHKSEEEAPTFSNHSMKYSTESDEDYNIDVPVYENKTEPIEDIISRPPVQEDEYIDAINPSADEASVIEEEEDTAVPVHISQTVEEALISADTAFNEAAPKLPEMPEKEDDHIPVHVEETKPAQEISASVEEPKSEPEAPAPAEEPKSEPETTAPAEEPKSEPETTAPVEESKPEQETTAPVEESKSEPEAPAPAEEPKSEPETTAPAEETKPELETTAPAEEPKPEPEAPAPVEESKSEPETTAPVEETKPEPETPEKEEENKPAPEIPAPPKEEKKEEAPKPAEPPKYSKPKKSFFGSGGGFF